MKNVKNIDSQAKIQVLNPSKLWSNRSAPKSSYKVCCEAYLGSSLGPADQYDLSTQDIVNYLVSMRGWPRTKRKDHGLLFDCLWGCPPRCFRRIQNSLAPFHTDKLLWTPRNLYSPASGSFGELSTLCLASNFAAYLLHWVAGTCAHVSHKLFQTTRATHLTTTLILPPDIFHNFFLNTMWRWRRTTTQSLLILDGLIDNSASSLWVTIRSVVYIPCDWEGRGRSRAGVQVDCVRQSWKERKRRTKDEMRRKGQCVNTMIPPT